MEAVEAEGSGGGGKVAVAFADVQVVGVLEGGDDGGADGRLVGARCRCDWWRRLRRM